MKGRSSKSLDLLSSLKCLFLNIGECASKSCILAALLFAFYDNFEGAFLVNTLKRINDDNFLEFYSPLQHGHFDLLNQYII